jgi:hypothetical protein
MMSTKAPFGAGLGLKRDTMSQLQAGVPPVIDFFEVAPENWIGVGGRRAKQFAWFAERYPFVAHGLSLSLGGPDPLNEILLQQIKGFLEQHRIALYTEHLSYCSAGGYLYDLLPIPLTAEAVKYVAARIRRTQEILERRIAVENASYYVAAPMADMSEPEFIRAVLDEADCDLHLDVNNVYVNSVNFGFDPYEFMRALPAERVVYMHTAGHYQEAPDLIVDTHGETVIAPVWELLDEAYRLFGIKPTLLERDLNIPPLAELEREVGLIAELQSKYINDEQKQRMAT